MSFLSDYLNATLSFGKKADETKDAKSVQDKQFSFRGNINPNNVSYKDPIVDNFGVSQERAAETFKNLSTMFLVGFCFGCCPSLLLLGVGAFLFANQQNSFKDILSQMIQQSNDAFSKLNQQVNANAQPEAMQPQQFVCPQPTTNALPAPQEQKLLEYKPEEPQPMTPLEKAQMRCANAENNVNKWDMHLNKATNRANIANQKLERAYARMDRARTAYENAKEEAKIAAEAKFERASMIYEKRYAESQAANERVDYANAKLEEAKIKLEAANTAYATMQAEETVDLSAVPV